MLRNLFLFLMLVLQVQNFSYADDSLDTVLNKVAPAVSSAGTIDYKAGCANCKLTDNGKKSTTLYSKNNDKKIDLTVLSEDEANELFSIIAARTDIPFGYPMEGCYARAHKIVRILEEKGIIAGKAFIEGNLLIDSAAFGEVSWGYHVAPVVMVKKGNTLVPYIFDPSIFNKAVPYTEWKAKITTKSKSKIDREYFTNRFSYDPADRKASYTSYSEENLNDMDNINKNFTNLLAMYNESKG